MVRDISELTTKKQTYNQVSILQQKNAELYDDSKHYTILSGIEEASVLYEISANYHTPLEGYCIELGVARGGSASVIAAGLSSSENAEKPLFCVDQTLQPDSLIRWKGLGILNLICYIIEDDISFLRRWYLPTRMILIDTSHSYESMIELIPTAIDKLQPGGWLLCHDYNKTEYLGVSTALNEYFEKYPSLFDMSRVFLTHSLLCIQKPLPERTCE